MKRLFITTFFPSSNVPSSTSCSKSLPSSSGGLDFIEQILKNKGITDSFLMEINDVSTLQKLARDHGLPFEPLQKYYQNLLKHKTSTFEPIRHNSNQASILTSPSRSSSLLSSLMNDSYLEESLDDDQVTSYSSRSASISIPSSHSPSTSIVKSFGTISSSIDEHFFDDEKEKLTRKSLTTNQEHPTTPVNYETTTTTLSQEEKAKKELENILDIIHDNNHTFPKSALVAAFRKTINEGRLPSSPALNPTSPSSPGYKSFMFNDVDSDSEYDDSPTSPVL